MDALLRREVGLLVHVETTPPPPPGSPVCSPTLNEANHNDMFFFGCFAALGEKRQALHDIIAKSAVYKKADIAA